MNINIIVAYCKNQGIGLNNNLPWSIKSDLKKFYKLTHGNGNNAIIMGKNTWESINSTGLKKRDNLILSTTLDFENTMENNYIAKTFSSPELLIYYCKNKKYDNIWIIGGEKIYSYFFEKYTAFINKIYVTYIDKFYECDSFFPKINLKKFRCISCSTHNSYKYYPTKSEFDYEIYDEIYINDYSIIK